jgi:hypothetical protein
VTPLIERQRDASSSVSERSAVAVLATARRSTSLTLGEEEF